MKKIAVVGLGKLGLPVLTFFASRGLTVVGVDKNQDLLRELRAGIVGLDEPGVPELFRKNLPSISITDSVKEAVLEAEIMFILVPTPSTAGGEFSSALVAEVIREVGQVIADNADWRLVVLSSTVSPGETEKQVIVPLEESTGKKCGVDFGVCYGPEFVALGSVLKNISDPEFMLIGSADPKSASALSDFYQEVWPWVFQAKMSCQSAELAKIALNAFVTTKISFANMLAELCEQMPGFDIDAITDVVGLDSRIGRRYLKAGLGFGGPCFPRDNFALAAFAEKIGVSVPIPVATDCINHAQLKRVVDRIIRHIPGGGTLAVLGLSYKTGSVVLERSQGFEIALEFLNKGFRTIVYDHPPVLRASRGALAGLKVAATLTEAVSEADGVVITLPDERFVFSTKVLKSGGRDVSIFDAWRILKKEDFPLSYYSGVGVCA